VRLRGCVAIELAVGGLLAAAGAGGAVWGVRTVRAAFPQEASAAIAELPAPVVARAAVEPPSSWDVRPDVRPVVRPWVGLFQGKSDDLLVEPLRTASITEVKLNRGGTSLSLRLDFDNGARAACKPEQVHLHSQPRREIAAYRINRLLGLSTVPPAIGRRFLVSDIVDHLPPDSATHRTRVMTEMIPHDDGTVLAELSWWIPVLEPARIDGFEIDSVDGVVTWKRYLTVGQPIPADELRTVSQVSDMLLFDFLINNIDRWSGGNVKASGDRRVLYFMDNTMAFGDDPDGHSKVRTYLHRCQKFSRRMVRRLRHLREAEVREVLTHEIAPFDHLLEEEEIAALLSRRDHALEYIDGLIEEHGREAVLVFP